jgi:hypothetical protein
MSNAFCPEQAMKKISYLTSRNSQATGKLELHVPTAFTAERPPARFEHESTASALASHPLGSLVPDLRQFESSFHPGIDELRAHSLSRTAPIDIKTYLTTDEPVLSIYIATFSDASFITITHPHAIADAQGTRDLLHAWSQTIVGQRDNIAPLHGVRHDVFSGVGEKQDVDAGTPYVLAGLLLSGLPFLGFVLRHIWDLFWTPRMHTKIFYISAEVMSALRNTTHDDLKGAGQHSEKTIATTSPVPFVSDGDIVTAWFARRALLGRSATRSATIMNIFDVRSRMSDVIDPLAAYAQNLVLPTYTFFSPGALSQVSLGQVAMRVREAIVGQTVPSQIRALLGLIRTIQGTGGGHPNYPLFGHSDSMIFACTNWSKVKFLEALDLSAAMASPQRMEMSKDGPCGRCVAYWGSTVGKADGPRDTLIVYNRDTRGGYWVHGFLREKAWRKIEEDIKSLENGASLA